MLGELDELSGLIERILYAGLGERIPSELGPPLSISNGFDSTICIGSTKIVSSLVKVSVLHLEIRNCSSACLTDW